MISVPVVFDAAAKAPEGFQRERSRLYPEPWVIFTLICCPANAWNLKKSTDSQYPLDGFTHPIHTPGATWVAFAKAPPASVEVFASFSATRVRNVRSASTTTSFEFPDEADSARYLYVVSGRSPGITILWLLAAEPVAAYSQIDVIPYRTTVDPTTEVDHVMVTDVGVGVAAPVTVIVIPFVVAFRFPELAVSAAFDEEVEFSRNVYVVPEERPVTSTEWVRVDSDA